MKCSYQQNEFNRRRALAHLDSFSFSRVGLVGTLFEKSGGSKFAMWPYHNSLVKRRSLHGLLCAANSVRAAKCRVLKPLVLCERNPIANRLYCVVLLCLKTVPLFVEMRSSYVLEKQSTSFQKLFHYA